MSEEAMKQQQPISMAEETTTSTTKSEPTSSSSAEPPLVSRTKSRCPGYALRTLLLDFPLFLVLSLYASSTWLLHVHRHYLEPQLHAAMWDRTREVEEVTYYARQCTPDDISTHNGTDLFLPQDATPQDAYDHQLKHGFTVFRNAMSVETATNLRNYIADKNYNLTEDETIYVIEWDHRYSFGLDAAEPRVAAALGELLNHKQINDAVEKIHGTDGAILEMTAITIAYGAVDQWWHPDVQPSSSATRNARSFEPSFSLFVQLQDTTPEMGATSACPGTHMCGEGDISRLCDEHGFQLVDETGVWKTGDALLMNTAAHHRGGAHTDKNAEDRVMLLLTFSPKQEKSRANSRQMSRGISFSLRWDMWGLTWTDLANAQVAVTQPWATLRALGLYKPKEATWGVDFISGAMTRMSYEGYSFDDDSMERLQERGGLLYLPAFLQGDMDFEDDLTCHKFLVDTAHRVHEFLRIVSILGIFVYLAIATVLSSLGHRKMRSFLWSLTRFVALCGSIFLAFVMTRRHVDSSQWAQDIRNEKIYANVMENEEDFLPEIRGVTTFPNRHDVLIENRLGNKDFNMYDDFIRKGHHGNRQLLGMVDKISHTYGDYPQMFRDASARYLVESMALNHHGRFLEQGVAGRWHWVDQRRAMEFTKKELARGASRTVEAMTDEIRYAIADYRFGTYRQSSLARKHMVPFLRDLEKKVVLRDETKATAPSRPLVRKQETTPLVAKDGVTILDWESPVPVRPEKDDAVFKPSSYLSVPRINASDNMRASSEKPVPTEPTPGAWFAGGSLVEGHLDDHWYTAQVALVTAHGRYLVQYEGVDEEFDYLDFDAFEIRPFENYRVGEQLEVLYDDEGDENIYEKCEIVAVTEEGDYHIVIEVNGQYVEDVDRKYLRRDGGDIHQRYQAREYY